MNDRVEELFHQLADVSPEERGRYLAAENVDAETRAQVEALLAFDSSDSVPFERDIAATASGALATLDVSGNRCGPFRLEKVIGRGGMGVVYLAVRDDGEVSQRVAIKLLRPGLSDEQRERFFGERQILAGLDHPHIARLLDAGRLMDGQPYLAMEFVDGKPIHEFTATLPLRAKIQLFLKVCEATAYLHRNLVIHRDLKPSNILVTPGGEPKLLDFGIAKLLDDTMDSTITGLRMLTPDYASPEQVMGERIGTASDIYSLGAVLYQILTGHTPHDFAGASPSAIANAIAGKDIAPAGSWAPVLRGDLEMILSKALRREPGERFQTVEQFAGDLEAYLEHRPISARKGETFYRARKFVSRYWLPVSAAIIAFAGLAGGLAIAERERTVAQRRFDDVRQLSNKLFEIDVRVRELQGSSQTRQFIVDTALAYLNRLVGDARGDLALSLDLGTAYMRVGRVQGVPISVNLGQSENAEANLRVAEGLIGPVLQAQPRNRMAMHRMAQIQHDRMILAQARRPDTGALALAESARGWWERYLDSGPVDLAESTQVCLMGVNIADWLAKNDRRDAAERMLQRTIEVARRTGQTGYVGSASIGLTRMRRVAGDLNAALAASGEAVRLLEPVAGEEGRGRVYSYSLALETHGEVLGNTAGIGFGRNTEAAGFFAKCMKLVEKSALQDPADASSRFLLSSCAVQLGRSLVESDPQRALQAFDDGLARSSEIKKNTRARRREIRLLAGSAEALRRLGRLRDARARLELALARLAELKMYPGAAVEPGSEAYRVLGELAEWEAANGNWKRGIAGYVALRQFVEKAGFAPEENLDDAVDLVNLWRAEARFHRAGFEVEEAGKLDRLGEELRKRWRQKRPNNVFVQEIWR